MREIKFRAWDKVNKVMEDEQTALAIQFNGQIIGKNFEHSNDTFEIMQYTGLKDKNGKEIFEGDIIEHYYHGLSEVFYQNGGYKINGKLSVVGFGSLSRATRIIGNIYENPELIK